MDYYEIGQRIRKYRKEAALSQEQLAEAVNISVTHMSHIETGNTKLSLQVLVDIADTLRVGCDRLLKNSPQNDTDMAKLIRLLSDCNPRQINIITEVAAAVKKSTDKFYID